jgi:hypothetical protein
MFSETSDLQAFGPTVPVWHAIAVRPSTEKSVAKALTHRGLEIFSPTYKTQRLWSGRSMDIELPLFPGFIFAALPANAPPNGDLLGNLAGIQRFQQKPLPVDQRELHAIRLLIAEGVPLAPWPYLNRGAESHWTEVVIGSGKLRGIVGVLVSPGKFVISLTALQRSILADLRTSDHDVAFAAAAAQPTA